MDFRILGPLEIAADSGAAVPVGGGKEAALLAILLLHANEPVSISRLVDLLWDGTAPATAPKILQNAVSRLRRGIGDDRLVTRGRGYQLRVEPGELDLDRFRRRLDEGRRFLGVGEAERASRVFGEALDLWSGPPLADFAGEPFARGEVERLEELRLGALTERIEAELAVGRHAEALTELEALVARNPLDERLRAQLMLALYRCGRQADALHAYQDARRALVDELGIEPGRALRGMEHAILNQDAALDLPPAPALRPRVTRRRSLLVGLAGLALAAAAVAAGVATRGGGGASIAPPNAVAIVDPRTNDVVDRIAVGMLPDAVAAGAGTVWVLNGAEQTVSRIDPHPPRVTSVVAVGTLGPGLTGLVWGFERAWVADPAFGRVFPIYPHGNREAAILVLRPRHADVLTLAIGDRVLWVGSAKARAVFGVDPVTHRVLARIPVGLEVVGVAAGGGVLAVAGIDAARHGVVGRFAPRTGAALGSTPLPGLPTAVAFGYGSIWVVVNGRDAVWRIDPATGAVESTIAVGAGPTRIAFGARSAWVANARGRSLTRVDVTTNRPVATIPLDDTPRAVAFAAGRPWVAGA